jgi:hypothetical protein
VAGHEQVVVDLDGAADAVGRQQVELGPGEAGAAEGHDHLAGTDGLDRDRTVALARQIDRTSLRSEVTDAHGRRACTRHAPAVYSLIHQPI